MVKMGNFEKKWPLKPKNFFNSENLHFVFPLVIISLSFITRNFYFGSEGIYGFSVSFLFVGPVLFMGIVFKWIHSMQFVTAVVVLALYLYYFFIFNIFKKIKKRTTFLICLLVLIGVNVFCGLIHEKYLLKLIVESH